MTLKVENAGITKIEYTDKFEDTLIIELQSSGEVVFEIGDTQVLVSQQEALLLLDALTDMICKKDVH